MGPYLQVIPIFLVDQQASPVLLITNTKYFLAFPHDDLKLWEPRAPVR